MMPRLWLDYQRASPGYQLPGRIVLGVGIGIAIGLVVGHFRVTEELDRAQTRVTQLKRAADRLSPGEAPRSGAAGRAGPGAPGEAGYTQDRWSQLFAALESSGDASVTLLAMRPAANDVQIAGEAANLPAALDYVKRLQSSAAFGSVNLTQSEVVRGHPRHPVRFTVLALWREAKP